MAAVTELVAISQLLNLLIRIVPVRSHLAQPQKEIVESSFGEDLSIPGHICLSPNKMPENMSHHLEQNNIHNKFS